MTAPAKAHGPAAEVDHFASFDLPRRYPLDLAELERRYHERARAVHPDRVVGGAPAERARAAAAAIDLNQAYRVLRRPASRAEHLLALEGVTIGGNEPVAQELLVEVLELREELAEARARGDQAALGRLEAAMRERERRELDRVAAAFARLEADAGAGGEALGEAKAACVALRYVHRYLEALASDDDEEAGG
jgi:molecular chaperone HscB